MSSSGTSCVLFGVWSLLMKNSESNFSRRKCWSVMINGASVFVKVVVWFLLCVACCNASVCRINR